MLNTLHLLEKEAAAFDRLPAALKDGWTVKEETIVYADSPDKRRIRFEHAHITDPQLLSLKTAFADGSRTIADTAALIEACDLRTIRENDVREILYALGPDALSLMIAALLQSPETDDDLREIAGYATARHLFFGSHE